ncbi:MAG: hypothetical protein KDC95_10045, partial [Planctomycetes bacterium]|nr:hypothetical protein [Planctomycetota bacterium]
NATPQTLLELGIFSQTWLRTNIILQAIVIEKTPAPPQKKKIKVLLPVRIHKRSIKTSGGPPTSNELVPTICPTVNGYRVHAMIEDRFTVVPLTQTISQSRLVFVRVDSGSGPFLVIPQEGDSSTSSPVYKLPIGFVNAVTNATVRVPQAYVYDINDQLVPPIFRFQDWSNALLTFPLKLSTN